MCAPSFCPPSGKLTAGADAALSAGGVLPHQGELCVLGLLHTLLPGVGLLWQEVACCHAAMFLLPPPPQLSHLLLVSARLAHLLALPAYCLPCLQVYRLQPGGRGFHCADRPSTPR